MYMRSVSRWLLILPATWLTTVVAGGGRQVVGPGSGCSGVAEWIQAHKKELPTTYMEIIRYPVMYRQRILGNLPMEVRRDLWRTQRQVYAGSGLLTTRQVAFLDSLGGSLDSIFVADSTTANRLAAVTTEAAIRALGQQLTHQIMYVLGPDDEAGTGAWPAMLKAALANRIALPTGNCVCHVRQGGGTQSDCTAFHYCNPESSCTPAENGCGALGEYSCNGQCDGDET